MRKKKPKVWEQPRHPFWKRAWTKFAVIPIGVVVAVAGLVLTYKLTGADELRSKLYQPLYADMTKLEESLQAASIEKVPIFKALLELRQTGVLERVPVRLQERILNVLEEAPRIHMAVLDSNEIVIREMSSRIMQIRTQEEDRLWLQKTSNLLREMSASKKGISDSFTLFQGAKHSARSQSIDLRDPNKPVISGPGGPTFVINDWLGLPESLKTIEDLWKDIDYLYFNETKDLWYYRLTREDLNRHKTTLGEFLLPVHEILWQDEAFQVLRNQRAALLSKVSDIKVALTDRIRDPKQLRDLIAL